MKRYAILALLIISISLVSVWIAGAQEQKLIQDSKHNLSSGSTNTIRAKLLDDICVFCHTPHGARSDAPLWNRSYSQGNTYTPYSSDVMEELGITADDPYDSSKLGYAVHVKTRICLSCHDGTVALGTLVNFPNPLTSKVATYGTDASGKMKSASAGFIGTDLSDDHPVAVQHTSGSEWGKDPELKDPSTIANNVRLYRLDGTKVIKDNNNGNYVECTSCHDAHDDRYGNFLVNSNEQSKICMTCHDKAGYATAAHSQSTEGYSPPTGGSPTILGSTVGEVKCMVCHYPHRAGITTYGAETSPGGKYLLTYQEEATCFNTKNRWGQDNIAACHAANASTPKRNIESLVNGNKAYYHPVSNLSWEGRHEATEARSTTEPWLGVGNPKWHVECVDCHNPHTAGDTVHTRGTNLIESSSPLYGVQGVQGGVVPSDYPAWPNGTGFSYTVPDDRKGAGVTNNIVTGAQYEYEICLKCHSDFAWGSNPPAVDINIKPSPSLPISTLTNQAMEFGNNATPASSHPVIFSNANTEGGSAYKSPWTNGSQTMYCSDCHTNNDASPNGPHGSSYRAILKNAYDPASIGTDFNELCFDCHDYYTYSDGSGNDTGFRQASTNLHRKHMAPTASGGVNYENGVNKACTNCHVNPPHGINRPHLISYSTDAAPYGSYSYVTNFSDQAPGNYTTTSCSAVTCHSGSHP